MLNFEKQREQALLQYLNFLGKRDAVLSRIKVRKIEDQRRMLAAAKANSTLVVTDRAASLRPRTTDFVIADALIS